MKWSSVLVAVLIPAVIVVLLVVLAWRWYRRSIAALGPDADARPVGGARLTSERLRELSTPPWRIVYEIGGSTLGSVDHVIVGPVGVIAIETIVGDRPHPEAVRTQLETSGPQLMASAAVTRSGVDDLIATAGTSCGVLARVFWGPSDDDVPPAFEMTHGLVAVDGHRLGAWLDSLTGTGLTPSQVDLVWQHVVTGIGRPDPLP